MPHKLKNSGNKRNKNNNQNHQRQIVFDNWNVTKEVACQR
jgi:hypothetical protein